MKNYLKIINIIILFIAIFSFMIVVSEVAFCASDTTSGEQQKVVTSASIPEKNAYSLTHMKKTGFKYTLFKFFIAMLGVIISIAAILFGLKLYKNFILKNNVKTDTIDYDKYLETPKDFKEAINLFLDKTDK